jgi:hypothetical protein
MSKKKISVKKKSANKRSPKKNQDKIYIQIASYRDPELLPTIADALDKAKYPKNLVFGICWQHSPYDEWDNLDAYIDDERFRIIDMDYRDARGVPYARYLLNKQWKDEKYTLQLDSHHRFKKNWDAELIKMLESLRSNGHKKPLLSSYIPSYEPANDPHGRLDEVWIMEFDRFAPEGPVHFLPHGVDDPEELRNPIPSRFMSAHFIFADGKFCKEVEYDPTYYFHGEEINLAVRSYMAGYDLFVPNKVLVWHEYTRDGKSKHWDDHSDWSRLDRESYKHGRKLLGMNENEDENNVLTGSRSLLEYEMYAGLSFKDRRVHQKTVDKERAPVSFEIEEHLSGLTNYQRVVIDLYKESFSEDYIFWAVAIHDRNNNEIYRKDADEAEIRSAKNADHNNAFLQLWRSFNHTEFAHSWVVWPQLKDGSWGDRVTGVFNDDN